MKKQFGSEHERGASHDGKVDEEGKVKAQWDPKGQVGITAVLQVEKTEELDGGESRRHRDRLRNLSWRSQVDRGGQHDLCVDCEDSVEPTSPHSERKSGKSDGQEEVQDDHDGVSKIAPFIWHSIQFTTLRREQGEVEEPDDEADAPKTQWKSCQRIHFCFLPEKITMPGSWTVPFRGFGGYMNINQICYHIPLKIT